jgi:hypothetical protein
LNAIEQKISQMDSKMMKMDKKLDTLSSMDEKLDIFIKEFQRCS